MQNKIFIALCFCGVLACHTTVQADFQQVQPYAEEIEEDDIPPFQPFLIRATDIHTLQMQINDLADMQIKMKDTQDYQTLQQKRYDAMQACNIRQLRPYFSNPEEAWKNITNVYDTAEQELATKINLSSPTEINTPEDNLSEQMATWNLGKDILMDVYANPEKYGKLKGNSFPLWEDQKYLYLQQMTEFVASVNAYFGLTGPISGVRQENTYQQNQQAYANFLRKMAASFPEKMKKLPSSLMVLPPPPKALPPAQEILHYFSDPAQTKSVYPKWPEPWKAFIDSNFKYYNPTGEMARDFIPKTLSLKEEVTKRDAVLENNRLNVYQELKKTLANADEMVSIRQNLEDETVNEIDAKVQELGFSSPDWLDTDSVILFRKKLVAEKEQAITQALDALDATMKKYASVGVDPLTNNAADVLAEGVQEYAQALTQTQQGDLKAYRAYLLALRKDSEGKTSLGISSAQNVDQYLDEKEAFDALMQENLKEQQAQRRRLFAHPIDSACLNGGI